MYHGGPLPPGLQQGLQTAGGHAGYAEAPGISEQELDDRIEQLMEICGALRGLSPHYSLI
jgi:hypothetical protein